MTTRLRFGIFPKVLLTMIGVAVIPLSTIWYLTYASATARLSGQVDQQLGDRADAVVSYVDAWVDMTSRRCDRMPPSTTSLSWIPSGSGGRCSPS